MTITEVNAKTVLRKHGKIDSWFIARYGMNLYRGCSHNCTYCDGRAEGYYTEGEFGKDVVVKVNAIEVLSRELDPRRKRVPMKGGFVMVGGGVGDSYQPIERKYELSRRALQLVADYRFPVHMLTKSTLIKRDVEILNKINEQNRAMVSFSFSSVDDRISGLLEPGVPPPSERLKTIEFFKREGMACGMFLLPVVPFITDTAAMIEESVRMASDAGVDFIIFGGMTLKEGKQKRYFLDMLGKHYPDLVEKYGKIYPPSKWGEARGDYSNVIHKAFNNAAKKYRVPKRIPPQFYQDIVDRNDLAVIILEHIDYLLKLEGEKSPYGYAAYSISKVKEPLWGMRGELRQLKGIGAQTERIILEILETGRSAYYEKLMVG